MKRSTILYVLTFAFFILWSLHSCKKETIVDNSQQQQPILTPPPPPPITTTYVEEFARFDSLTILGWLIGEYSQADTTGTTAWNPGLFGIYKADTAWYGFTAYSNEQMDWPNPGEYAYSYDPLMDSNLSISSWMLTPILTVKNGDSISFYTRGDTTGLYTNRMQVLLNMQGTSYIGHDLNSVGDFTQVLYDINPTQAPGGYPTEWTRYVYTFAGLAGTRNIRIGFRHFVIHPTNARGIGIDQFTFGVK